VRAVWRISRHTREGITRIEQRRGSTSGTFTWPPLKTAQARPLAPPKRHQSDVQWGSHSWLPAFSEAARAGIPVPLTPEPYCHSERSEESLMFSEQENLGPCGWPSE
jgi:hypothetical protein